VGARVNLQSRRAVLKQFAPQYHEAASAQKGALLDTFVHVTGYHQGSGMWLLNHAEDVLHAPAYKRASHYGLEVQHALFLVWHAANRICAKRLIPFLPTLLEALERHEHLHLTEECRSQLLSMSAATADRLLRSQRTLGLRGLSTTRAGTQLKQQIPIRTFEEWKETRPGFLEADLVAHCGTGIEGGYLYTLTLTDVATGWTDCLPFLYRGQEAVLAALQRARMLFPSPILGIDTDNGGEFINEALIAYCEQEHITFTRGRPSLKNDQCFVEQKNGAIVRQVVGYDRFVGEHAYRQLTELTELYRALRLYVNIRLLHQLEQLQQAVFRCAASCSPFAPRPPSAPLRIFSVEHCTAGTLPAEMSVPDTAAVFHTLYCEKERRKRVLGWRRTHKDPFEGEWEQILCWLVVNPER
jgi:hypothetical protein